MVYLLLFSYHNILKTKNWGNSVDEKRIFDTLFLCLF